MFYQPAIPAADPLARILPAADAGALEALADYFDHQAKECRYYAAQARYRARDSAAAAERRERARATYLRTGARLAVLERRSGHEVAVRVMMERTGWCAEQLQHARALWNRTRVRKKLARRNVEIYRKHAAGIATREIAAAYALTPRQVAKVVAAIEQQLRN